MKPDPPLFIIVPVANDPDLAQVPWCEAAKEKISVNRTKFKNLEMVEVIVDAMPFLLSRLTAPETSEKFTAEKSDLLFCNLPTSAESAIGVSPGHNLSSGRHLPEVNRRLLMLGNWIGESLAATVAAWMPTRRLTNFAWFGQAVEQYLADGPFPCLLRTSVSEVRSGYFVTKGLHYFAGQEVRLIAHPDYDLAAVTRHLVQIIDDISTNGKIVKPARSEGLIQGESLIYSPSDDLGHVDVRIQNDAFDADPAKI